MSQHFRSPFVTLLERQLGSKAWTLLKILLVYLDNSESPTLLKGVLYINQRKHQWFAFPINCVFKLAGADYNLSTIHLNTLWV